MRNLATFLLYYRRLRIQYFVWCRTACARVALVSQIEARAGRVRVRVSQAVLELGPLIFSLTAAHLQGTRKVQGEQEGGGGVPMSS